SDHSKPYGCDDQQDHINIVDFREQEGRNQNGRDNDKTTHRGCALLLQLTFQAKVPNIFANLTPSEVVDKILSESNGDEQGDKGSHARAERDVMKHPRTRKIEFVKIVKQVV